MKKFFRNCPYPACPDCRECPKYRSCKQRLAERRKKRAAEAVKNTHCRPRNAYQMAVINTYMSKISLKGVAIVLAIVLFLATCGPTLMDWFTQIAIDLEYDWGIRTVEVTTPDPVTEFGIDEEDLVVSNTEMGSIYETDTVTEPVTTYPDAPPENIYTATHEGARPYLVYFFTPEEKLMIAKVVYEESRGECYEGQVAVAAVVINRYINGGFGKSIWEVISRRNQFADISHTTEAMLEKVPSCMRAVEDACRGWDPTREWFEDGALYFYNPNGDLSEEARAAREGVEQYAIGNHNFHVELNET